MPALRTLEEHMVKVVNLQLRDFRGFSFLDLKLEQDKPVNVFIADNGGGKTTILDAIAGFLNHFLEEGIQGDGYINNQKIDVFWKGKDVRNNQAVAYCKATLELTYQYPAIALLEAVIEITEFLNEYQLEGQVAWLVLESSGGEKPDESWRILSMSREGEKDIFPLSEEIEDKLDRLIQESSNGAAAVYSDLFEPKISTDDNFIVARKKGGDWFSNLEFGGENQKISKVKYRGVLDLEIEINKSAFPLAVRVVTGKSNNLEEHIFQLRKEIAFLDDFFASAQSYNSENTTTTLPLIVYYGGAAFNTRFGEVGIWYKEQIYQAYAKALEPNRFDFEEFFEWLNWIKFNEPNYIFDCAQKTIVDALNADGEVVYKRLRIEKGQLWLDKIYQKEYLPLPVEVSQLSAGEKNMFALIGDLVKRAIQLNTILFKVDFDETEQTYSNPLEYTQGIVLIDEVDLHLHPKWQRQVMPTLRKSFPKVQFLVTTHSPFVIQGVDGDVYQIENGILQKERLYGGWDIEKILFDKMGVSEKYGATYENLVEKFFEEVGRENIESAGGILAKIVMYLPESSPFKAKLENRLEALKEDW